MTRKSGFTLAEVLITLGIIGVVAAMTIPSLMNQTNGAEYKTGMKKALSVLNQAITMNVALDGNDFSALSTTATNVQGYSLYNMFVTRMNIVATGTANAPTNLQGTNYALFFNDGMIISFPQTASLCTTGMTTPCTLIVDVNGIKKPNKLSMADVANTSTGIYDEFVFNLQNQQVVAHDSKSQYVLYN